VPRFALVALALALLTAAAFLPVRENGFVSLDDPTYVTRNRQVLDGLSPAGARWALTTFHAGNWHPLTWLSHMADVTLFGLRPGAHHLAGLAIHLLTTMALFAALRSMTGALWPSAAVAALFGIHPLHVESVAWAAERKDLLCGLFFVLALGAYTRHLRTRTAASYLAVCAALGLALLAKPMAVTAPFVLLLLDFWPFGRITAWRPLAARVAEKIPLYVMSAASAAVTLAAQSAGGWMKSAERYPLGGRLANSLFSGVGYLRKTFWPVDLAVPYGYPEGLSPVTIIACALVLAAVTFLAVTAARHAPFVAVGWLWFLGMLVPVVGIVQVGDQGMADRYTYLPLIGIFLALAWGLRALAGHGGARRATALVLAAAAIVACGPLTWRQAGYWRSDLALFSHAMKVTPRNWLAHDNYGATLIEEGRYAEAATVYQELLRNGKVYPSVLNNLGVLAMYRGNYMDAEARLRQAIALRPGYGRAHFNLGALYARQGRVGEAARSYERAAALGIARPESEAARLRPR
jgi:hypothetical protein